MFMAISYDSIITTDDALKKKLDVHGLQVVDLTCAITPTYAFLTRLGENLKKKFGAKTILRVAVDSSVVGGAIVSYKGRYVDLSLKKKLEKYFLDKKEEILKKLES